MRPLAFALLFSIVLAGPVRAGADCVAADCTVDSALVLCPAADLPFTAIARIAPGVLAFRVFQIYLDVTEAPGLRLVAQQPSPGCTIGSYGGRDLVIQDCQSMGTSTFRLSGGGAATGTSISVHNSHDAVVLATRVTFLSPDQNGDLVVDGEDLAILEAKLGTHDATGDFDFDGTVTAADRAIALSHYAHFAAGSGPVAARTGTWGRLKSLFR